MSPIEETRAVLDDAMSALRYVRQRYGALDGVGWDRVVTAYEALSPGKLAGFCADWSETNGGRLSVKAMRDVARALEANNCDEISWAEMATIAIQAAGLQPPTAQDVLCDMLNTTAQLGRME